MPRVDLRNIQKRNGFGNKSTRDADFGCSDDLSPLIRSQQSEGEMGCGAPSSMGDCGCGCSGNPIVNAQKAAMGNRYWGDGMGRAQAWPTGPMGNRFWGDGMGQPGGYASAGLGASAGAVVGAGQAGLSFASEPSWEGAAKLGTAAAAAADVGKTECKPDPLVMAIVGGAVSILTGGLGMSAAVTALIGAAASILPGVVTNAIGCDAGKKKLAEALKKCFAAMDQRILYMPLRICDAKRWGQGSIMWTNQTQAETCAGSNNMSTMSYPNISSDSAEAKARIEGFFKLCIEFFGAGRDIKDSVVSAIFQMQYAGAEANTTSMTSQLAAAKKQVGATPASVSATGGWSYKSILSWAGGDEKYLDSVMPGWQPVYAIAKKCIEGAITSAVNAAQGLPPPKLEPTVTVDNFATQKAGGMLPFILLAAGAGTLLLAAKKRQDA